MENASKALIIAGAILISIILIGIGIMVINAMNPINDQVGTFANSADVQIFNDRFTGYAGNKSAQDVKGLISAITASNGQNRVNVIYVVYKKAQNNATPGAADVAETSTGLGVISSQVNTQRRYVIALEDGKSKAAATPNGYYDLITITEQE